MNPIENEELNLYETYLVLKKRYKLIVGTVVVSLILVGIITYLERPIYRNSFTVRLPCVVDTAKSERKPVISVAEFKKIIDELNYGLKNKKRAKALSDKLGIAEEEARALSGFSVASTKGDLNEFIEISIDVHDQQFKNDLKNALLQFLNENQYAIEKTTFLRKKSQLNKKELEASFKEMQEIRDIVFSQIKREGPKYIGFNPLQLEREFLDFKTRLVDIEDAIRSLSGFEIVTESMIPQKIKPRVSVNFTLAVISSLIVGIFLSFMLEWLEKNVKKGRHASGKENI